MTCGIYKITNKINGKCYIGQSIHIEQRWKEHKILGNIGGNSNKRNALYEAIYKYGIDNFLFEIIEECSEEKLDEKEIEWIKYYNSYYDGYNLTIGGNRGSFQPKINYEQLNEIRKKLMYSNISLNKIAEEYNMNIASISEINLGKSWYESKYNYPLRKNDKNPIYFKTDEYKNSKKYCKICGKELKTTNLTGYCIDCINNSEELRKKIYKHEDIELPSRQEFKLNLKNMSWSKLQQYYKVSQHKLLKWCENYYLPKTKDEIKKYSDKEWLFL